LLTVVKITKAISFINRSHLQEIVKYKRNLSDPDLSARDLHQDVIEFFQHHLLTQPYPTWEILYHIINNRNKEKNRLLEELVLNALMTLIDLIIEHPDQLDKRDKLYNLLSNIFVSEWCMKRIKDIIIPRLFDLKEHHGLLNDGESLPKNSLPQLSSPKSSFLSSP
jgi:hypothetical protein